METMTKPKIGDLKVIVKPWGKEFAVEVSVFKQNTLRGDAYWVSKVFRTLKKKADADKFASRTYLSLTPHVPLILLAH